MLSFRFLSRIILLPVVLLLLATVVPASAPETGFDPARAKLLGFMLQEGLPRYHYSQRALDDTISEAAYTLFLEGIDFQKRFLLKPDVAVLAGFRLRMDDELRSGQIRLPQVADTLIRERLAVTRQVIGKLLAADFDFTRHEMYETDPEKLDFAATEAEFRERWRQALTYQVLAEYVDLEQEEKANLDKKDDKKENPAPARTPEQRQKLAREKVQKSYDNLFQRLERITVQDRFNAYLDDISRAFDPHTSYMPPTAKEDFDITMRGSLEGIGATLQEEGGYIKVLRVIPGSAAARQGELEVEDLILKVAQADAEAVDVTDMSLRDAVSMIRGKKGTEVRLTVKKPDARIVVISIVRDVVQIEETFVKSTTVGGGDKPLVGFIKIPSFYRDFSNTGIFKKGRNATDDVRAEVEALKKQKISGLIIDLRNDGGGALPDAIEIAGLFLNSGPVVQVRTGDGSISSHDVDNGKPLYDGPLVILVNQFSASSSEILAGVLQDYGRAVIIGGKHTHGKGTVQSIIDLDRGLPFRNMEQYKPLGALKVTIQKFYRISGASTQYRGVASDIILPDRFGHLKTGEKDIKYSLPWDTIAAVPFTPWPDRFDLPQLQAASAKRVAADTDFQRISREAERAKIRSEETLRSLNIVDFRKERKELLKDEPEEDGGEMAPHGKKGADTVKEWQTEVDKDPYIREASKVLGDMLSAKKPVVAGRSS